MLGGGHGGGTVMVDWDRTGEERGESIANFYVRMFLKKLLYFCIYLMLNLYILGVSFWNIIWNFWYGLIIFERQDVFFGKVYLNVFVLRTFFNELFYFFYKEASSSSSTSYQ